jgi:membrane protein
LIKRFLIRSFAFLKHIRLPGLQGVPLYYVFSFFYKQIVNESVSMRAASIAFRFFIALFPALIFLFTIIPYIPIENLQAEMMVFIKQFLPDNVYILISDTLEGVILQKRADLLSFSFLSSLYFASNGMKSLLKAFNPKKNRKIWTQSLLSIYLTLLVSVLSILSLALYIGGKFLLNHLKKMDYFQDDAWLYYVFVTFQSLMIIVILFTIISVLFYYGTDKNVRFAFYSAGALISALLIGLASWGFAYYINNFGQYNKVYGSIGTVIVLMLWLNLIALSLIYGYEFNQGIAKAKSHVDDP